MMKTKNPINLASSLIAFELFSLDFELLALLFNYLLLVCHLLGLRAERHDREPSSQSSDNHQEKRGPGHGPRCYNQGHKTRPFPSSALGGATRWAATCRQWVQPLLVRAGRSLACTAAQCAQVEPDVHVQLRRDQRGIAMEGCLIFCPVIGLASLNGTLPEAASARIGSVLAARPNLMSSGESRAWSRRSRHPRRLGVGWFSYLTPAAAHNQFGEVC